MKHERIALFLVLAILLCFTMTACASRGLLINIMEENPYNPEAYAIVGGLGSFEGKTLRIPSHYQGVPVRIVYFNSDDLSTVKSLYIPETVTQIWNYSWPNNPLETAGNLTEIKVAKGNQVYYSENNCLIKRETAELIRGCENSKIPNDVKIIAKQAFSFCDTMESITIPNSVEQIHSMAFRGCTALTEINYLGTMEEWKKIGKPANNLDKLIWAWNIGTNDITVHCTDGDIIEYAPQ